MVALATYQTYRKISQELMSKVMQQSLSRDAMDRAAKALGIMSPQGIFMFESEEEMAILSDFALNDVRTGGTNAIAQYRATTHPVNPIEEDLLVGFATASTSLFRVIATRPADHLLVLRDLLRPGDDVHLTDVNLSATAVPGLLLFLRIVPLREFAMTSGFMFVFPGSLEKRLLADYQRLIKKSTALPDARGRFMHYFKAHQARGAEVRYQ